MATMLTQKQEAAMRALETIAALAAILGEPTKIFQNEAVEAKDNITPKTAPQEEAKDINMPSKAATQEKPAEEEKSSSPALDSVLAWSVGIHHVKRHDPLPSSCPHSKPRAKARSSAFPQPILSRPEVIFRPVASVVDVPHHKDVPPEVATAIWTSSKETAVNRERNVMEWHSEWVQGDWTRVLEEDQMIKDPQTGELHHPATWEMMQMERQREEQLSRMAQDQVELRRQYLLRQVIQTPVVPKTKKGKKIRRVTTGKPRRRSLSGKPRRRSLSPCPTTTTPSLATTTNHSPQRRRKSKRSGQSLSPKRNSSLKLRVLQPMIPQGALTRFADT